MLYTRKGDDGTTKTIASKERFSKSSSIAEALGVLDELNSLIGLCKAKAGDFLLSFGEKKLLLEEILHEIQEKLFIIQAEIAGPLFPPVGGSSETSSLMNVPEEKIKEIEKIIDLIEKEISPVKSFFIPGENKLSAIIDLARTVARRAEREVIGARDENMIKISSSSLSYLNRLSSLLYALARIVNHEKGRTEKIPNYK